LCRLPPRLGESNGCSSVSSNRSSERARENPVSREGGFRESFLVFLANRGHNFRRNVSWTLRAERLTDVSSSFRLCSPRLDWLDVRTMCTSNPYRYVLCFVRGITLYCRVINRGWTRKNKTICAVYWKISDQNLE